MKTFLLIAGCTVVAWAIVLAPLVYWESRRIKLPFGFDEVVAIISGAFQMSAITLLIWIILMHLEILPIPGL